jgi:hypothetical protein
VRKRQVLKHLCVCVCRAMIGVRFVSCRQHTRERGAAWRRTQEASNTAKHAAATSDARSASRRAQSRTRRTAATSLLLPATRNSSTASRICLRTSDRLRPPPCQHVCRRSAAWRWLSIAPARAARVCRVCVYVCVCACVVCSV